MANAAGMLKESIWRDRDFRALPRTAQATYAQLLSQKELDRAGMLPLQVSKWAKGCDEITDSALWDDLKLLQDRRFIFVDEDTDEVFIRSYMRHSEVTKYPQFLKAAIRCAGMVASEYLRAELAAELRKLRRAEATELADRLNPSGTLPEPSGDRAATVPEPSANPSDTVNPSGTLPEPSGVGERVGEGTSVVGHQGVTRARDFDTTETTQPASPGNEPPKSKTNDPEPPTRCRKHQDADDVETDCGPCANFRKAHQRWAEREHRRQAEAASAAAHTRAELRTAAIQACQLCDPDGYLPTGVVCDHVDRVDTNARGMAAVRAALAAKAKPESAPEPESADA